MTNEEMRDASGTIQDHRPVVSFLYQLLRDHLPAGEVEKIMEHVTEAGSPPLTVFYTNGWLARYAQNLADRMGCK